MVTLGETGEEGSKLTAGALVDTGFTQKSTYETIGRVATSVSVALSGLRAVQIGREYGTTAGIVEFSEAAGATLLGAFEERTALIETGSYLGSAALGTYVSNQYYNVFHEFLPPSRFGH